MTRQQRWCLVHPEKAREIWKNNYDRRPPEYGPWQAMKRRCYNKNYRQYKDWGGRGVTVCSRWRDSFAAFLEDMGPRPSSEHSIDRIDVNGNYEPENCRWATVTEQASNRR